MTAQRFLLLLGAVLLRCHQSSMAANGLTRGSPKAAGERETKAIQALAKETIGRPLTEEELKVLS